MDKEALVKQIIEKIGDDPTREGLLETPDRVTRMWQELFKGYNKNLKPVITTFQNGTDGIIYDQMIIDEGTFYSHCEHHMVPFFGKYWFAYIPSKKGKLIGLSKVARVVDYCAAKLQVQERLTQEIVRTFEEALEGRHPPKGIALVMKGEHLCKTMRGAKKQGIMTTIELTGVFRSDEKVRAEFLHNIQGGQK